MNRIIFHSFATAVIITIVFLILSHFDVYLEKTHNMNEHKKIYFRAPMQFALIFVVSATVMYFFSHWFHVKQT